MSDVYFQRNTLESIVGAMFSGKSDKLLRRGKIAKKYGNVDVHYFKSGVDTRDIGEISSRANGLKEKAIVFERGKEVYDFFIEESKGIKYLENNNVLILIDEGQFADESLVPAIQLLSKYGANVVVAGLPDDFARRPFGIMPEIMRLSGENTHWVYGICNKDNCSERGRYTQRLVPNTDTGELEPAHYDHPIVVIEGSGEEKYETRCEKHHDVPGLENAIKNKLENLLQ